MPIGPSLPPHLAHLAAGPSSSRSPSPPAPNTRRSSSQGDDESDDDAFGPALPPHLAAARKGPATGPSRPNVGYESPSPPRLSSALPKQSAGPSRPVGPVGPSRPSGFSGPSYGPRDDEDSDDDVIGPVLPSGPTVEKSAVEEFREREERMRKSREVSLRFVQPITPASQFSSHRPSVVKSNALTCRKKTPPRSLNGKNGCSSRPPRASSHQ